MAEFQQTEVLNELGQVFRGRVEPTSTGAVVDPQVVHSQILEIASLVFLNNPNSFYYLAKIVRNTLSFLVIQEVAIVEDMLAAITQLEHALRNDGNPIGVFGPTELSNARTALLALDAASTVKNRPELARFSKAIDKFVSHLRMNVVDGGKLAIPRGEARDILKRDIELLKKVHERMLSSANSLKDLSSNFRDVDIPTRASRAALFNVRKLLQEVEDNLALTTPEQNITISRLMLLRALTTKVAVNILAQFQEPDPNSTKLNSDGSGTAASGVVGSTAEPKGTFTLRAAGTGNAASALTLPGPWLLDSLSTYTLGFKIDDGVEQTFDLSQVQGPGLTSRNAAPFTDAQLYPVWPGIPLNLGDPPPPPAEEYMPLSSKSSIHMMLDPKVYSFHATAWEPGLTHSVNPFWNKVTMQPPQKLGFKHLGALFLFSFGKYFGGWTVNGSVQNAAVDDGDDDVDSTEWGNVDDRRWPFLFVPRVVTELALLKDVTLTHAGNSHYTAPAGTFESWYVGFYIRRDTGPAITVQKGHYAFNEPPRERYEIVRVISDTEAVIDTRTDPVGSAAGSVSIFGEPNNETTVEFAPDLLLDTDAVAVSDTGNHEHGPGNRPSGFDPADPSVFIKIGPAMKTAQIPAGAGGTIGGLIAALQNVGYTEALEQPYSHLAYHCIFKEAPGGTGKLVIQGRTRYEPQKLQIVSTFLNCQIGYQPASQGPWTPKEIKNSAHPVLGFDAGQKVDLKLDVFLSPKELLGVVKPGIDATTTKVELVETDVLTGLLNVNPGTATVTDSLLDFVALGIGFGYQIEVKSGDAKGKYIITASSGGTLTLQVPSNFVGAEVGLEYRIYTEALKISSLNKGPGSSVRVTQAPTQFGLPTSTVYGTTDAVEAVNAKGDNLNLSGLSVGDSSGDVEVVSVSDDGKLVTTKVPVSSDFLGVPFAFKGKVEGLYKTMTEQLTSILTSSNGFTRQGFDKGVGAIDTALTAILTPGTTFLANLNQAGSSLLNLLSLLTNSPKRSDEYSARVPPVAELNMETLLSPYDAPTVEALNTLIDTLLEYKYDRAAALLLAGRVQEFFETDSESASFAGYLLKNSRSVVRDMPNPAVMQQHVESDANTARTVIQGTDAEEDFSDVGL